MQHYAALQNPSRDWWYDQIVHCSDRAAYFLYSLLFPDADLSFLFPVRSICLLIFCSLHPCVCRSILRLRSGCFRLQYPRCVCTLPRRWSCCRGRGPRCWCIWWIWWVTKQLFVQVCVWVYGCVCVCVWTWKLLLLLLYYKAASASIGDSRTNMCPQGLLSLPKSCSNAPVMDPLLLHLDNSSLPNIHPVNTTVKSTILLLTIL